MRLYGQICDMILIAETGGEAIGLRAYFSGTDTACGVGFKAGEAASVNDIVKAGGDKDGFFRRGQALLPQVARMVQSCRSRNLPDWPPRCEALQKRSYLSLYQGSGERNRTGATGRPTSCYCPPEAWSLLQACLLACRQREGRLQSGGAF